MADSRNHQLSAQAKAAQAENPQRLHKESDETMKTEYHDLDKEAKKEVCKASHYQLGSGWKLLILCTFLIVSWLLANPHYEPAQRIHISNPEWILQTEFARSMSYDALCTKDTIITSDFKLIGTKWVKGGQCAWVENYQQLVLFKRN
jgi:hypothetical protein